MKHFKIASLALCFCFFVSCGSQVVNLEESKNNQTQSPYEPTNPISVEEKDASFRFPISNYKSNDKAYLALENEYAKKGNLTGEEVNRILFKDGEENLQLNIAESFYGNTVENKIDWTIEKNSYWPERKVGKLRLVKYEAPKSSYGRIDSDNLENNIKKYAKETLSNKIGKDNEVRIIPLSEDICFVDVSNYISIIRLNSDNPVLRPWGKREMWPDFSKYDGYRGSDPANGGARLFNIFDVNFDGIMDFVFQFHHHAGGHNFFAILRTFTIIENDLHEIVIEGECRAENGVGISKDGNLLVTTQHLGCPHMYKGYWSDETSRIEIPHQFEIRKDDFIYDVTYKYSYKNLQSLLDYVYEDGKNNSFWFQGLADFDVLGLSEYGQKKYLENPKIYKNKIEIDLVKDLLKNKKPFHVLTESEILNGWKL